MSRFTKFIVLVVVVVAAAAVAWFLLRGGDPTGFASGKRVDLADFKGANPTGVPSSLAQADLVARGEYLTRAADCAACHTAPGGKPFAGGLAFKLPMIGTIYSTNITPDPETGIGAWSDEEFLRALHQGIGKTGKHLYPAFPYTSYALLTDSDVLAIKAYLFSLKPIHYAHPRDDVAFPFNQRYLMMFWNILFKPAHRFQPNADQPADWNRGAYLVEALGHCGDCHTPRNILFGLNNHRKFAGAVIQGWKAYNITSDHDWGIGAWSDEQLQGYFSRGHADGRSTAGGPMAEVIDNSLQFLTAPDIAAMVTYLKTRACQWRQHRRCGGAHATQAARCQYATGFRPKERTWLARLRRCLHRLSYLRRHGSSLQLCIPCWWQDRKRSRRHQRHPGSHRGYAPSNRQDGGIHARFRRRIFRPGNCCGRQLCDWSVRHSPVGAYPQGSGEAASSKQMQGLEIATAIDNGKVISLSYAAYRRRCPSRS